MKKTILLVLCAAFIAGSCTNKKPVATTLLGDYTPYDSYPEKMAGKVEKVVEKNYWGVAEGDTYVKGNPVTVNDRDSLPWTYDFVANFDINGNLTSCTNTDENGKTIDSWVLTLTDGFLSRAEYLKDDTLRMYNKLTCNEDGKITELLTYRPVVDTLVNSWRVIGDASNDTVIYQGMNWQGEPTLRYVVIYDSEGRYESLNLQPAEGGIRKLISAVYNDQGKVSELRIYDKEENVKASNFISYEYDKTGNWVKAIVKDDKGNVIVEEREYTYYE